MLTRSAANLAAGRSSAMRRLRRRAAASSRLYCATNGCTSFLTIDPTAKTATCEICGYRRRLH